MQSLLFPRHWLMFLGVGAAIINAFFRVVLVPVLLMPLVDAVLVAQSMHVLPRLLITAGLVVSLGALALWIQDGALGQLAARVLHQWRLSIYKHWLEQSGRSNLSSGGFSSRILADLKEVELFLQYGVGSLVAESCTLIGIIIVLLRLNLWATLTLLVTLIPVVLLIMWAGRALQKYSEATQAGLEALGGQLQEGFSRRLLLRAFQAQNFAIRRFSQHNDVTYVQQQRRVWLAALQTPLAQLLGCFALLVLLGRLLASAMTAGEIMGYFTLVALLSTPAQLLPRAYSYLQMARAAAIRLQNLQTIQDVASSTESDIHLESIHNLIFHNLSFAYSDHVVLQKVSLELHAPCFLLITGESGAGKSTLLKLLLGALKPSQGSILINTRIELATLSAAQRARYIAYVPQSSQLFQASIADNLCLGRDIHEAALWNVLQQVGLHDVVAALPEGLETILHEATSDAAVGLSLGQQQRLSLARALLGKPQILLVDEVNANLDTENERRILEVLQEYAQHNIVIMVSHRPRARDYVDVVYELEAGTLISV